MPMINCPECGKQISNKASMCPNCGCPSSEFKTPKLSEDSSAGRESMSRNDKVAYDIIKMYSNPKDEIDNIAQNISNVLEIGLSDAYDLTKKCLEEKDFDTTEEKTERIVIEVCEKYSSKQKYNAAKELMERTGMGLNECADIVKRYFSGNRLEIKSILESDEKKEFDGIYRYTLFGGKQEVYCPRCNSSNCSHYKEQRIVPGKTKTKYTLNLNPLKPLTLVNKKEKIIKKEKIETENKIICNDCGYIFY